MFINLCLIECIKEFFNISLEGDLLIKKNFIEDIFKINKFTISIAVKNEEYTIEKLKEEIKKVYDQIERETCGYIIKICAPFIKYPQLISLPGTHLFELDGNIIKSVLLAKHDDDIFENQNSLLFTIWTNYEKHCAISVYLLEKEDESDWYIRDLLYEGKHRFKFDDNISSSKL